MLQLRQSLFKFATRHLQVFPRALTACRHSFSGGTSYSAETLAADGKYAKAFIYFILPEKLCFLI